MQSDILFDNVRRLSSMLSSDADVDAQVYLGNSASDAEAFAKETFHIKKPVEDAAEEAEKPAPAKDSVTDSAKAAVSSFAKDPLRFVRSRLQNFVDVALIDPVGAFKAHPQEGAIVGGILATLLGMIAFRLSALLPV